MKDEMASKTITLGVHPWDSSKLFFKADMPGQKELRTAMRTACERMRLTRDAATYLTWLRLVEVHGGDEQ